MQIKERSYNTKIFRPKPILRWEIENQFLMVATNWGAIDSAHKILDEIAKYVTAAQGDVEVTTPFEFLPQLSPQANALRIATLLANELIFRSDNRNEFVAGIELCLILKTKSQLSWLQVGQPHLYFKQGASLIQPLSIIPDLSFDHITPNKATAPLPKDMLGTESILMPHVGHCLVHPNDQLLLISRPQAPADLGLLTQNSIDLKEITLSLTQENQDSPFWLGLVDFA